MHLEMGKRLCDATLGEFVAAERTVGILSGWAVALFTATLMVAGRWAWRRWRARRLPHANAYYGGRMASQDYITQEHLRKCKSCEVVVNLAGEARILACSWWYAQGLVPPYPPPGAAPSKLADAMELWQKSVKLKGPTT